MIAVPASTDWCSAPQETLSLCPLQLQPYCQGSLGPRHSSAHLAHGSLSSSHRSRGPMWSALANTGPCLLHLCPSCQGTFCAEHLGTTQTVPICSPAIPLWWHRGTPAQDTQLVPESPPAIPPRQPWHGVPWDPQLMPATAPAKVTRHSPQRRLLHTSTIFQTVRGSYCT